MNKERLPQRHRDTERMEKNDSSAYPPRPSAALRGKKVFNAEDAEEYAEGRGEERSLCVSVSLWLIFLTSFPRTRVSTALTGN